MESTVFETAVSENLTVLELLLITSLSTVVGGVVILSKWFYDYLTKTNTERSEEIKNSVKVQTELKGVIEHNNYLIENLPDRIQEKVRSIMAENRIQTAIETQFKKSQQ